MTIIEATKLSERLFAEGPRSGFVKIGKFYVCLDRQAGFLYGSLLPPQRSIWMQGKPHFVVYLKNIETTIITRSLVFIDQCENIIIEDFTHTGGCTYYNATFYQGRPLNRKRLVERNKVLKQA